METCGLVALWDVWGIGSNPTGPQDAGWSPPRMIPFLGWGIPPTPKPLPFAEGHPGAWGIDPRCSPSHASCHFTENIDVQAYHKGRGFVSKVYTLPPISHRCEKWPCIFNNYESLPFKCFAIFHWLPWFIGRKSIIAFKNGFTYLKGNHPIGDLYPFSTGCHEY